MELHLTSEQEQQIASLAQGVKRSKEDFVLELVTMGLARMEQTSKMLSRADEQIAAGAVLSHEEVGVRMRARSGL